METIGSPESKKEDTTIGKILKAIETKDKTVMISSLNEANQILTGRSQAHFQDDETLSDEVDRVLEAIEHEDGEVVYLGDGGFSRLLVGIYLGKPDVDISDSSLEDVKIKWKKLQAEYDQAK